MFVLTRTIKLLLGARPRFLINKTTTMNTTLLHTVGNTPLIQLHHIVPNPRVRLLAKLEGQNPGGSIKDRVALFMVEQAESRRELLTGKTIIEATSGNMGIALALVGAQKRYPVHIVMSEGMSQERRKMLRALDAKLTLTPALQGTQGAIEHVHQLLADAPDQYWFADQFNNPDNARAHHDWTAGELLEQEPDIDVLIAGLGTTGTMMGMAERFRTDSPHTQLIGVVPPPGYAVQGLQHPEQDFSGRLFDRELLDQQLQISAKDAYETARLIARKEGLFVGMSSGAAIAAALEYSKTLDSGTIVVIIPDRGEKYLSTSLYQ